MIVDPRFADKDFRDFQKYVGQTITFQKEIVHYLDALGEIEVLNETGHSYRFLDMTAQAEALVGFISETISKELVEELDFLEVCDKVFF